MPDPTDSPDSWSKVPLAWERASGALFLSRQRGWVWRGVPAGTAVPERLVGHHTTGTHQDVVSIDLTDEKGTNLCRPSQRIATPSDAISARIGQFATSAEAPRATSA